MKKTEVKRIRLDFLDTNCYVVYGDSMCFLIDPGSEAKKIIRALDKEKIDPDFIINTHCHYDHIGAAEEISGHFKIPVYIHKNEEEILNDPDKNLSSFFNVNTLLLKTYNMISGKENKDFLLKEMDVINTPGHTPGSIIIRYKNYLFTGDLLFKSSIGRTDLPGGSSDEMQQSLAYLKKLEKSLIVFPGHGADTTLQQELKNNVFLK